MRLLGILIIVLLTFTWIGGLIYFERAGTCQQMAKHYHYYTEKTPLDCMDWRNWK